MEFGRGIRMVLPDGPTGTGMQAKIEMSDDQPSHQVIPV